MARPVGTVPRLLASLRDGPRTAQALAADVGLDVSSVRRHLDSLEQRGWVAFEDRITGPGRPKRHYTLTETGWESFPRDYAFLLVVLLEDLQARLGRDMLLEAFSDVADRLAADIGPDLPPAARLDALRQLYNDLGFEASIETHGDTHLLVQRNCPFLKVAKSEPEGMCGCLDQGIMRSAMPEADVELGDCMATGDRRCTHAIKVRHA